MMVNILTIFIFSKLDKTQKLNRSIPTPRRYRWLMKTEQYIKRP